MRHRLATLAFAGSFSAIMALAGAGALAQAEAERQLDAALERLRASFGPEARLTTALRQVDPVTGRARLGDLSITAPGESLSAAELLLSDVTETRLGRAEARSLILVTRKGGEEDRFELARLVLGGMALPPPGQPFSASTFELGQLEAEGLRGAGGSGTLTAGRITAEGYGPGVLGAGQIEGMEFREGSKGGTSFRLGRVAVQSLVMPAFDKPDPDPRDFSVQVLTLEGGELRDPAKDVDLGIGRFAVRDWVRGRTTDIALEGLRLGAPFGQLGTGTIRIGRMAAQGIDAATSLAAAMDGLQVPDPVPGTPQTVTLEGMVAEAEGRQVFALGRMLVDASMDTTGLATGGLMLQGLRITLPQGTSDWLEGLGYREISGGSELRGNVRREGGILDIEPFRVGWDQAATLTLRAALANMPVPKPGEPRNDDAYLAQLMQGQLRSLTLGLRDQGLLGRVIAQQARQQRLPEAQLREQYAQMALGMPIPGASPRGRPPAAPARKGAPAPAATASQADPFQSVREALAKFIRQPGEIDILLRPAQPVSFADWQTLASQGPLEAARRLGLSAVAR
ncbi:hypothetical protein ACLF3G_02625 [Falsiroseomonas sp. HC035]|uniref:hypothetical protein n=1 Tax=Falsiroseomonas sp. HC035 TaxID=3390999 RepID=UPI003D3240F1